MNPAHDLSIGTPPDEVNVFVEIPRGAKNKYELDKETGLIKLDRVFYTSFAYPLDYGLVPQTLSDDGDQLDALIINSAEPYYPGVVVPVRVVAVINMTDSGEQDEKLVCVPVDDPRLEHIKDKDDVAPHIYKEVIHFFEHYKDLQKKKVTIEGVEGRDAAVKVLEDAAKLYQEKQQ